MPRLRFSLRTLMIVVTVAAALAGLLRLPGGIHAACLCVVALLLSHALEVI